MLRDLIRADHRTKLDDAMPWPGWPGQKGCDLRADVVRREWKRQHGGKNMPSNWRSLPRPGAKSPERTAHEAVDRVARAIVQHKTRVIA